MITAVCRALDRLAPDEGRRTRGAVTFCPSPCATTSATCPTTTAVQCEPARTSRVGGPSATHQGQEVACDAEDDPTRYECDAGRAPTSATDEKVTERFVYALEAEKRVFVGSHGLVSMSGSTARPMQRPRKSPRHCLHFTRIHR